MQIVLMIMARQRNDGRGRLGGRAKGTPNKITTEMREWVQDVLDNNKERFMQCLEGLDPQEYVRVFLRLLNFVLPKQAPIAPSSNEPDSFQEFMSEVMDDELD